MPMYQHLRRWKKQDRERTVDRILSLRKSLRSKVPERTVNDTLLLATWNVRDFDSNNFKHGPRLDEAFYYIAEVISSFDLVAVQEVNRDLAALDRVMRILGPNWKYIATDITEGRSGNNERAAFLYDERKVRFQGVAGEIVLPKGSLVADDRQFARTPFMVNFQSGWFKFSLCSVHLYYGDASGPGYDRRVQEIGKIAQFLAKRAQDESTNMILLGDMNVVSRTDDTFKALGKAGFHMPEGLALPTNMLGSKYYDQIAFLQKRDKLKLGPSKPNAGVVDYYRAVFRLRDSEIYYPLGKHNGKWPGTVDEREHYYEKEWRTWQMSDHFPLWIELKIDFTESYLNTIHNLP